MTPVMFDVDGTLAESSSLDATAFLDTLRDVFGFDAVPDDRAGYRHVTDAGLLEEVLQTQRGRTPTPEEIRRAQKHSPHSFPVL